MTQTFILPVEASLSNPGDPAEVTLVADVLSVGTTNPTGLNQILTFSEEYLAKHAKEFIGKPVNIWLEDGLPTAHSKNVIGSITSATFDPVIRKIRITASLWRHYFPETVNSLLSLFRQGKLQTSAEVTFSEWEEEQRGKFKHITPRDGMFVGMGIVGKGADPRNQVLALLSAYENDAEALSTVMEKNDMASMPTLDIPVRLNFLPGTTSDTFTGNSIDNTTNQTVYVPTFIPNEEPQTIELGTQEAEPVSRLDADSTGEADMPTDVTAESPERVEASAESPSADNQENWKAKYEELAAKVEAQEADALREKLVSERLSELGKIKPIDSETEAKYAKFLGNMADEDYTAMKSFLSAAIAPAQGIASDAEVEPPEELDSGDAVVKQNIERWRQEAIDLVAATPAQRES